MLLQRLTVNQTCLPEGSRKGALHCASTKAALLYGIVAYTLRLGVQGWRCSRTLREIFIVRVQFGPLNGGPVYRSPCQHLFQHLLPITHNLCSSHHTVPVCPSSGRTPQPVQLISQLLLLGRQLLILCLQLLILCLQLRDASHQVLLAAVGSAVGGDRWGEGRGVGGGWGGKQRHILKPFNIPSSLYQGRTAHQRDTVRMADAAHGSV